MSETPYRDEVRLLRPELFERFARTCERYRRDEDLRRGMELYGRPVRFYEIEEVRREVKAA